MNTLFALVVISLCGISNALRLPVVARSNEIAARGMSGHHGVKMHAMHQNKFKGAQNIENAKDIVYATNITLGGREFPIQLDTGSSDVWVQTPFALNVTNQTKIEANLTFGIGEVEGNIGFAPMSLGPYKVESQAFLNATNATNFGAIFSNGIFGILGLAFDQGSTVFVETLINFGRNNTQGRTFLGNVFSQNASAPNLFTVLLGRSDDADGPEEGIFTISEYDPEFSGVKNEPKLFRHPPQLKNLTDLPRWSVIMDSMTVNGKKFGFNQSIVPDTPKGSQTTILDTGFTFSQIPPAAVDFIYSSIPGSHFDNSSGLWIVPCENTTNLSFEFGGKSVPVHPLDITTVKTVNNQTQCVNTYRALNLPPGAASSFDMILGVSFLKNVYASFDYGDWTPDPNTNGLPFVQLLPTTTNSTEAISEFKKIRPHEVTKNNKLIQMPSNSTTTGTTGSLEFNFLPTTIFGLPVASTLQRRGAMVVYRMGARVGGCVQNMVDTYGAAVVSLLVGILSLCVMLVAVGVALAVRAFMRSPERREDGYEAVLPKEDGGAMAESRFSTSAYRD